MKKLFHTVPIMFCVAFLISPIAIQAQTWITVTLDSCYKWARENYPLTRQYDLMEQIKDLTVENLASENLPRIQFAGQATYQSEVTKIPVMVPGLDIPTISKDQYKAYGEITQSITRFKTVRREKELARTNHSIENKQLTISLRQLEERVNILFFGILLTGAQIEQTRITEADINSGLQRMNTALKNGTALPSDVDQLRAELLRLDQNIYSLQSRRRQLVRMLSLLTRREMNEKSDFRRPLSPDRPGELNRPELELFTLQQAKIDQQKALFNQQIKPQISLFIQGGLGRPALNFLDGDLSAYYLGGLRFQWNISAFYNKKRKNEIWKVQKQTIGLKSDAFILNTNLQLEQYDEEIEQYKYLLRTDQDIIDLRTSIKKTASLQLEQGVITPAEYLSFVHQEEQVRQSHTLHEIQLLQATYNRLYQNGN